MKKQLLTGFAVLVVLSVAALAFVRALPNRSGAVSIDSSSKSLRDKARQSGNVTASAEPRNLKKYDELGSLARESEVIAVGIPDSKASSLLKPNETLIVTDYQVSLSDVLKGNVTQGQKIIVREPGGHVDFGDGTSADVQMPDYWKQPEIGEKYILFLKSKADGKFSLVGGPQGLFKIAGTTVSPQGRPEDKLVQTYTGKNSLSFLNEISKAIKQ
jgi:hypothetical protein